jgi:chaperonin GroES
MRARARCRRCRRNIRRCDNEKKQASSEGEEKRYPSHGGQARGSDAEEERSDGRGLTPVSAKQTAKGTVPSEASGAPWTVPEARKKNLLYHEDRENRFFSEDGMAKTKKLTVRPLDDRVLVKPLEAEERTAGGIVLPDTVKEKPQKGTIVAVGPGRILKDGARGKMGVKVGDVILFGRYAGNEITIDGVEHQIMREQDILAIVE